MVRKQAWLTPLLALSLLLAPVASSAQYLDARQQALAIIERSVRIESDRPGAASEQGYGFVVGESVDSRGRPVLLVITADHVVRDKNNPDRPAAPVVTLYEHQDQKLTATLLDLRLPPVQGDLAVLEVAKPPGPVLKSAPMAAVWELTPGTPASRIGKLGVWLPSTSLGQYVGRDGVWLRFDGLDTPRGSSGAPVVTDKGLAGMVVLDQGGGGESRVLPIDIIAAKFREWRLSWDIGVVPPKPPPQPPTPPTTSAIPGRYPEFSIRIVPPAEIGRLGCLELSIARNEIFARHGYQFKRQDLRQLFTEQPWYHAVSSDVSGELTSTERKNIETLQAAETAKGC